MTKALVLAPQSRSTRRKSRRLSPPDEAIDISGDLSGLADGRGDIHSEQLDDTVEDDAPQPAAALSPCEEPGPEDTARHGRLKELDEQIASQLRTLNHAACTGFDAKLKIGVCLIEAKALCQRGEWGRFLENLGLKCRMAQECMKFAKHPKLRERKAHGRAHWTTEEARELIASEKRAIGHNRKPRSTGKSRPDRASETAAEPSDPMSTAATSEDQCGCDTGDSVEPAGGHAMDADESPQEGGQVRQGTSDLDELSDDDWLASIPLRGELEPEAKKNLDEVALLWRRTERARAQICEQINPSQHEVGRSRYYQMARNQLRLRLLFGALIKPPHKWEICAKCRGRFTDKVSLMPCSGCDGQGFLITHEGDEEQADQAG